MKHLSARCEVFVLAEGCCRVAEGLLLKGGSGPLCTMRAQTAVRL
jgi:hypothetical protein